MPPTLHTLLLTPSHTVPTPSHLPLLTSLQTLLNTAYTAHYCTHPDLFGREHIRLADPAQLADIIGEGGGTVVIVRVDDDDDDNAETGARVVVVEVVATGSVKDFGEGAVEEYAQWSRNRSGSEWKAGASGAGKPPTCVEDGERERKVVRKYEVTAFAVSPEYQAKGLGTMVLREIEGIVGCGWLRKAVDEPGGVPLVEGLEIRIPGGSGECVSVEAVDLDKLKEDVGKREILKGYGERDGESENPKLVLMVIREMGQEAYYQKRGFKSAWSGTVPVGMWDVRKECTMVYMEKDI
ncbi:hypothetical protein EX30DRAFT_341496 [Ascodesmis nigricans]|uniref:Uncharacterized protein n=1 Tax=Ascodesmis nigricans TaxID=341454 RepID=A0A4S2MVG0_9PEZI|nr:hypothetical protein EX30DRAFT_341496 [Ascodesmis nigricans]